MKLFKLLIITLLLSYSAFAQNKTEDDEYEIAEPVVERDSAYVAKFKELRKLYIDYVEAEYGEKADKTGMAKMMIFTNAMSVASKTHGTEIGIDAMMNNPVGNIDPKAEPGYAEAYNKLVALTANRNKSEAYLKFTSLNSEFYRKANFNRKTDTIAYGQTIFQWVEKNIDKTLFTSMMDADLEWQKLEYARKHEEKTNAEYTKFSRYCLHRYGSEMYARAFTHDMEE